MIRKILLIGFVFISLIGFTQQESYSFWTNSSSNVSNSDMRIKATDYLLKHLDFTSFKALLPTKHKAVDDNSNDNTVIIGIPTPDNKMASFKVKMSDIMDIALEAEYPEIRTFNGQGVSDPKSTIVLDYNLMGVHVMVKSPDGDYFIDPAFNRNLDTYIIYYKSNLISQFQFNEPALKPKMPVQSNTEPQNIIPSKCTGTKLRKYRCAIACTAEYAIASTGFATPTKAQVLSCIQTTLARVVGVYEVEFAITMTLISTESNIIFTNVNTEPFTGNNDATILINESQQYIDQYIGASYYDIGHTFSTGAGGLALQGFVCQNSYKAQGVTGSPTPTGDGYDIDYVAHEMGHEFGASHTFNDNTIGSCATNYDPTTNNEPGSGSTIMAYAGICHQNSPNVVKDDLQPHSNPYFTAPSFDQIVAYVTTGQGATCGTVTATNNNPPVVALVPDYNIPFKTPFTLLGSATDPNGDPLTYCWEQVNVGGSPCLWNAPKSNTSLGDAPIFRSFNPVTDSSRTFPRLRAIIKNADTIGEVMPTYARTLQFRLTARDNKTIGGGVCYNQNNVNVIATAGAFSVKYPVGSNVTWTGTHQDSVTWNVNGTDISPINCSKVIIDLSVDGGFTYPYLLLDSTPNTGSAIVLVPNLVTSIARVRVRSIGNIFFNISTANFKIKAPGLPVLLSVFNGLAKENANQLNWNSVTETGTDYFVIERSSDGKTFTAIDTLAAANNSTTIKSYSYIDDNIAKATWYYRLKMVDLSGEFTYSNIIKIVRNETVNNIKLYPNPAIDKIVISHNKLQNGQLNIYNAQGQLVHSEILNPNENFTQVNISNYCNGLFNVVVNDGFTNFITKFIKTN